MKHKNIIFEVLYAYNTTEVCSHHVSRSISLEYVLIFEEYCNCWLGYYEISFLRYSDIEMSHVVLTFLSQYILYFTEMI